MQNAARAVRLLWAIGLVALVVGCADNPAPSRAPSVELSVFAAASLTEAFGEIARDFEAANPGVKIAYNFAGSNQLAAQINQGAPADVFASASMAQMDAVVAAGNVGHDAAREFARNRLIVIAPKDNRADIRALTDLAKPGVKIVLADKAVPVGAYALDFLRKASAAPDFTRAYSTSVLANVVSYEENVRAVVGKVALGEADAGIVYTTDIVGDNAAKISVIDIPPQLNTVAAYPIAPVKSSRQRALAQKFVDFILSSPGQAILRRYGFVMGP